MSFVDPLSPPLEEPSFVPDEDPVLPCCLSPSHEHPLQSQPKSSLSSPHVKSSSTHAVSHVWLPSAAVWCHVQLDEGEPVWKESEEPWTCSD